MFRYLVVTLSEHVAGERLLFLPIFGIWVTDSRIKAKSLATYREGLHAASSGRVTAACFRCRSS
jgi:hypothetical protein